MVAKSRLLSVCRPDIASQWHPTKNGELKPDQVTVGASRKVWWTCEKGHEWSNTIAHRTSRGDGCSICSGHQALPGYNDLATLRPDIAAQWHPTKNDELKPTQVTIKSGNKIWWQCDSGHEWETTMANRTRPNGTGCPICSGKKILPGYNDLATLRPYIAAQWHPTKNGELTPDQVAVSANRKAWWICDSGHEWETTMANRTRPNGTGCPICSGKKILPGYNDLATLRPYIAAQWHPTKNGELTPDKIAVSANRKAWWICDSGHEWKAVINSRTHGVGCPVCAGQRVLPGYNDLATLRPDIEAQWHSAKNGELTPDQVTVGSNRKAWWMCERKHEWEAVINSRTTQGNGCPFCAGQREITGYNDLASVRPDITAQWHPTKNGGLTPDQVAVSSNRKAWWMCERKHEWEAVINSRTTQWNGCPFCAGQRVLPGYNDLAFLRPDIAKQWHPTLNGELRPDQVTVHSGRKVWWQCESRHEPWLTPVGDRTKPDGTSCPHSLLHHSAIEIRIAAELRSLIDIMDEREGVRRVSDDVGKDCRPDIVLSAYNIAIDIDGRYWHKDSETRDSAKLNLMENCGWKLIRVRESPLKEIGEHDVTCDSLQDTKSVVDKIVLRLQALGVNIPGASAYTSQRELQNQQAADDEIAGRGCGVDSTRTLATLRPDIAAQWHPTKNGELTPDIITVGSSRKAWWQCEQGHEWNAVISSRTQGVGCPVCSGKRVLVGYNDLATLRPDIAAQWHPTNNAELTPEMVTVGSGRKVWWQCEQGHEWEAVISSRAKPNGASCPTCSRSKRSNPPAHRSVNVSPTSRITGDYLRFAVIRLKPPAQSTDK